MGVGDAAKVFRILDRVEEEHNVELDLRPTNAPSAHLSPRIGQLDGKPYVGFLLLAEMQPGQADHGP